jgi:peptide/nickel transport system ATP-binding protein/oligopeptide transport system ATP-binding protein
MRAIPVVDPVRAREQISVTPARDAIDMPTAEVGCRFRALCPVGRDQEICRTVDPELQQIERDHAAACHFPQVAPPPMGNPGVLTPRSSTPKEP